MMMIVVVVVVVGHKAIVTGCHSQTKSILQKRSKMHFALWRWCALLTFKNIYLFLLQTKNYT